MPLFKQLSSFFLIFLLVAPCGGLLEARSKKGDKNFAQGRDAEDRNDYEKALEYYEKALSEDPKDTAYLLATRRVRFMAAQTMVSKGVKMRGDGKVAEALELFMRAYSIDPSSSIAEQEIRRTKAMLDRDKKKGAQLSEEERRMTPSQLARKEDEDRIGRALSVPELKPISRQITSLKMNNQPVKVLFETVGKLTGVNVIFDPEYQTASKMFGVDLSNTTLEDALEYLSVLTKSYWKPLSSNTIFVTNDNVQKRRDYEDYVVKVIYLQNVTSPQDLNEISTAVRAITEVRRLFTFGSQNAIIIRGSVDQVALCEKLLMDLDKPKSEVLVDVIVMEASRTKTRDLYAALTSGGTPGLKTSITPNIGGSASTSTSTGTTTTGTTTTGSGASILLNNLAKLSTGDFSMALPGAILSAVMTDSNTKVKQSPQLRAADGQKATLRIGDRVPTASGSFQPGVGTIGVSPLVNTQFQFIDVGVNVDMTPRVHGGGEISLHVELEISTVRDHVDIGGISQPVIGQRKVSHDVRLKEGEVNIIGGLMQEQDSKNLSGIPFLSSIPILKHLFTSDSVNRSSNELLIALIPHVVRSPEITASNLRGILAGNDQTIKISYKPKEGAEVSPAATPAKPADASGQPPIITEPSVPAAPKPPAPAGSVKLTFQPEGVETRVNSPVVLTLHVANATDLFSAPVKIKFDPKLLRMTAATAGAFLSGDGQRASFTENTLNDTGEATVNLNRLPGVAGISGSGALASFTFLAVGKGSANVQVVESSFKNSKMQAITAPGPQVQVEIR
jgi:general secretion pathway protein D